MKQFVSIAFSLLLIVAQTFAVTAPLSSGKPVEKPSCCGEDCHCYVSESEAPAVPNAPATVPSPAQNQFALIPTFHEFSALPAPVDQSRHSSCFVEFRAASLPIFQRNCSFLI